MFHVAFRALRSRHPLARLVAGVLSIVAVLALLALGTFVLVALLVGGALLLIVNAFRSASRPRADAPPAPAPAPPGVIEGEFTVVGGERVVTRR
jgi:hypothetical protein